MNGPDIVGEGLDFACRRYTGWRKKTSRNLCNYNGAYTLWRDISFCAFVDQYILLLTYKFK